MNNRTSSFEDYVDYVDRLLREHAAFVDTTTKQKTYFEKMISLFAFITSLFSFFLYKYLNELHSLSLEQISQTGDLDSNLLLRH